MFAVIVAQMSRVEYCLEWLELLIIKMYVNQSVNDN